MYPLRRNMVKISLWIIVLTACIVALSTADSENSQGILVISENTAGTNWPEVLYFPDAQERPRPGRLIGRAYYTPATKEDIFFKLYTRHGPKEGESLNIGDTDELRNSTFDFLKPTFILTHGFLSGINSEAVQSIKDMYLGFKEENVIAVDWSRIAANPLYFIVKRQTVHVAGIVADFVHFLKLSGVDLGNIHLCGHSLGAHVMGLTGKEFNKFPSKIARITGLDPAAPLYSVNDTSTRLDRDDADFVDVIHTCGGLLGFGAPIGKVDFFPNGGNIPQPGCPLDYMFAGTCSHSRAWRFYTESVNSVGFESVPCASYEDFQQNNCPQEMKTPMGAPTPRSAHGDFYLYTAGTSPFALG
ncbi:lipase member H-like [Hetaerina americana]|uniref:lipase member H-like n=1 Tax=Hetaerina americana TaxID=62018 RepID=UPI003A7F323F